MGKYVLITGTTSGIGHELAKIFALNKYDLITVARDETKLKQDAEMLKGLYGINVEIISLDLAKQESGMELFKEIQERRLVVDVLVNNAGIGVYGEFIETDLEDELKMINLNIVTPTVLTKLLLPEIKESGTGIINVASLAGFQPGPLMSVYYATKAYILHFTEAIAEELEKSQIKITALCPGPTNTFWEERANATEINMFKIKPMVMTPEEVAEAAFRGFMDNKRIVIPGLRNKLNRQLERILPRSWITSLYEKMNEKGD